jgi:hypothetical protein
MPAATIKIDRTTKWGNPFKVGSSAAHPVTGKRVKIDTSATSIGLYKAWLRTAAGRKVVAAARRELKGCNLACWCKPGSPCHGEVLLKVANRRR